MTIWKHLSCVTLIASDDLIISMVLSQITPVIFLQCDPEEYGACDSGCNGGLMTSSFKYTFKVGELEKEKDYPYTGTDRGTCKFDKGKIVAFISNLNVVSIDEEQIAANLVKNGPLASNYQLTFFKTQ